MYMSFSEDFFVATGLIVPPSSSERRNTSLSNSGFASLKIAVVVVTFSYIQLFVVLRSWLPNSRADQI